MDSFTCKNQRQLHNVGFREEAVTEVSGRGSHQPRARPYAAALLPVFEKGRVGKYVSSGGSIRTRIGDCTRGFGVGAGPGGLAVSGQFRGPPSPL